MSTYTREPLRTRPHRRLPISNRHEMVTVRHSLRTVSLSKLFLSGRLLPIHSHPRRKRNETHYQCVCPGYDRLLHQCCDWSCVQPGGCPPSAATCATGTPTVSGR